jgi:hypothetical protein
VLDAKPGLAERQMSVGGQPPKRLGNGAVRRAVVKVLAASDQPMRVAAVQAAVQVLLGRVVSYESVSWCLRMGSKGETPCFERASYYCYRLKCPPQSP